MKKRILILIYFLTLFNFISFGNKDYSTQDYLKIANSYFKDSSLYYKTVFFAKKALKSAEKKQNFSEILQSLELIGFGYTETFINNDIADFYLKKALKIAKNQNFKTEIPKLELYIESNKILRGNGENSLKKVYQLLNYFEKKNDKEWQIKAEICIVTLYHIQFKKIEIIKEENKVLKLCKSIKNKTEESYSLIRMANHYIDVKQYEKALSILKRYQEWRLGADTEMIGPKEITKAIDIVINIIDTKLNNNETDSI